MSFFDAFRNDDTQEITPSTGFGSVLGGNKVSTRTIGDAIKDPKTPSEKKLAAATQQTRFPIIGKGAIGEVIDAIPGFRSKLQNFKMKYKAFPMTKDVDVPVGQFVSNMFDDDPEVVRLQKKLDGGELLTPQELHYVSEAQIHEMFGIVLQSSGGNIIRKPGLVEKGGNVVDATFPEQLPQNAASTVIEPAKVGRPNVLKRIQALAPVEEGTVIEPAGFLSGKTSTVPSQALETVTKDITALLPKALKTQQEDGWCAPTALQYTLKQYGIDKSQEELADGMGATISNGADPGQLRGEAEKQGMQVQTVEGQDAQATLTALDTAVAEKKSVIIDFMDGDNIDTDGHYVVYLGRNDGKITVLDPQTAKPREIDEQSFIDQWKDTTIRGNVFRRWAMVLEPKAETLANIKTPTIEQPVTPTFDYQGAQALYDDLEQESVSSTPEEQATIRDEMEQLKREAEKNGYTIRQLTKQNNDIEELLTGMPKKGAITKLESELDSLIGYSNTGLHWKQEYGLRMSLLDAAKQEAPADVVSTINQIEKRLLEIREIRNQTEAKVTELSNTIKSSEDIKRIVDKQKQALTEKQSKQAETQMQQLVDDARKRIEERVKQIKEYPVDAKYFEDAKVKIKQQLENTDASELVRRQDISKELSEKLDAALRHGEVPRDAEGVYHPERQQINVKGAVDVSTVTHEIGHHIETLIEGGVYRSSKLANVKSGNYAGNLNLYAFKSELLPIATKPRGGVGANVGRHLSEGLAEFVSKYVTSPDEALEKAPRFYQKFETFLEQNNPDMLSALQDARVKYDQWKKMPAANKVLSQINVNGKEPPKTIRQMLHTAYTDMVNAWHPVEELELEAMGVKNFAQVIKAIEEKKILPSEVPSLWYRRYKGASGIATHHWIERRLQPLYRDISDIADDFRVYIMANRVLDRTDVEFGISDSIARDALTDLQQDTAKWARLEQAGEKYQQYNRDLLTYLKDSGVMSADTLAKIQEKNQFYAPAKRVMDDVETFTGISSKRVTASGSPIKTIKGSLREIIDPLEQSIADTYRIVDAAERNRVGNAIVELTNVAEKMVSGIEKRDVLRDVQEVKKKIVKVAEIDLAEIAEELGIDTSMLDKTAGDMKKSIYRALQKAPEKGLLGVYKDGEVHFYRLPQEVTEAINGFREEQLVLLTKVASKFTNLLRVTATGVNPEFSLIRNPVRDQITAGMQSRYGYIPFVDGARTAFQMVFQKETYKLWYDKFVDEGGSFAYFASQGRENLQKNLHEVIPVMQKPMERVANVVKTPYEFLLQVSSITEQLTRVAAKEKTAEKLAALGVDDSFGLLSNMEARDITTDFGRKGAKIANFNAVYAFLNPRIQGYDKLVRTMREDPLRASMYWMLWGVGMPLGLYMWNRQFSRYEDVKSYEKENYFIVMTNNDPQWAIRIPKPDFVKMVSIPFENAMAWLDKKSPDSIAQVAQSWFNTVTPIGVGDMAGTAVRPWLEMFANYNFFYGRKLIPESLKDSPPAEQYNKGTSEAAKALGRAINASPIIIDNFMQAYLAGTGRMVFQIGDLIFKKEEIPNSERGRRGIPIMDAFLGVNVTTSYDVSNEILDTQTKAFNELFFGKTDKALNLMESIGYYPTVDEIKSKAKSEVKRQIKKGDVKKAESLIKMFGVTLTNKEIQELTIPEVGAQKTVPKALRKTYQEKLLEAKQ